jgi:hypothetical protein
VLLLTEAEAYVHEWGCTLAEAIQFTGRISYHVSPMATTTKSDFRCGNPRSWIQQLHLGSHVHLLRPKTRHDSDSPHLRDIIYMESTRDKLRIIYGSICVTFNSHLRLPNG